MTHLIAEKESLLPKTKKKDQQFSLLLALKTYQKIILDRTVASFADKSDFVNAQKTCTDMHGPINDDIDRRQRFAYTKKIFHTIMQPLYAINNWAESLHDCEDDVDDPDTDCCTCCGHAITCSTGSCAAFSTEIICGAPIVSVATLASGCAFFGCWARDIANGPANKARDLQIKNLLPGISINLFEKSKLEEPPNHQEMSEDQPSLRIK